MVRVWGPPEHSRHATRRMSGHSAAADASGAVTTGADVDYRGQKSGYTKDPQEAVNYISKHDNETIWDISQYKHATGTPLAERVRAGGFRRVGVKAHATRSAHLELAGDVGQDAHAGAVVAEGVAEDETEDGAVGGDDVGDGDGDGAVDGVEDGAGGCLDDEASYLRAALLPHRY